MKKHILLTAALMAAVSTGAQAQVGPDVTYNDGPTTNAGGLISDWGNQYWQTATGTYSTVGSTGGTAFGVFEHYGPTGTLLNSAFVNNGSFDASVFGRDYFKGPADADGQQGIGGSIAPIFGELYLQNGPVALFDITNAQGATVDDAAFFQNGITTTIRTNTNAGALRFRDGAVYTGSVNNVLTAAGADAQHVNGYVGKIGNDAFIFPVGSGTDARPLQMSAPTAVTDEYNVAWIAGNPTTTTDPSGAPALHPITSVGTGIVSVSPVGQWDWIAAAGTGAGLTITVSIPNMTTFSTAPNLRLVGWNGSQWINLSVASGTASASGNAENNTLLGVMQAGITAIGIGTVSALVPDLIPTLRILPAIVNGENKTVAVRILVSEIRNVATTSEPIFVIVPVSPHYTVSGYNSALTTSTGLPVQNANWVYTPTGTEHVFQYIGPPMAGNARSAFGFNISYSALNSFGQENLSANIFEGSGGEVNFTNNIDHEIINYNAQ